MSKLLVVSHEASLTGAPRVAVDVLKAARAAFDELVVISRWPGPVFGELAAAADRARLEPFRRTRVSLRRFGRTRRAAIRVEELAASLVLRRERPDVVYLNTVKSACYVRPALRLGMRVILHSHEVGDLAPSTLGRYRLEGVYDRIRLVACSAAAQEELRRLTGDLDVLLILSAVDAERVRALSRESDPDSAALTMSGAGANGLVAACGQANEGKGTDLWLQAAARVRDSLGDRCPLFLWIGEDGGGTYESMAGDLGLGDIVRFIGPKQNPYPLLSRAQVVTVPYRSAPYPLVALEAMALGKPVVAFAVDGLVEQIGSSAPLVEPGSPAAMGDEIVGLLTNPGRLAERGDSSAARFAELDQLEAFSAAVLALVTAEAGVARR